MSDSSIIRLAPGFLDALLGPVRGAAAFLDAIRTAARQHHHFEQLSRMSDAELARRGLARQDIARHVFDRIS